MTDVVAGPWVEALGQAVDAAPTAIDPEGVHHLRVAARRLRVFLELGGRRILDDDLRWLRDEAGAVRDIDVLVAAGPPPALASWVSGHRPAAVARLAEALRAPRARGLGVALRHLAPVPAKAARRATAVAARRVLRRGAALEADDAPLDTLHALRRAVRRLRYALELTSADAVSVHALQDALGWLGDLRVALRTLSEWPGEAPAWEAELLGGIETGRAEAHAVWTDVRPYVEEVAHP